VFAGIVVNGAGIGIFLKRGVKTIPVAAIKSTLGPVQMATLLFVQYVFIAKSVNKTTF
jgi:hypothetical protein